MGIPRVYRKTASRVNTIFQWEDVIANIGYKTFSALKNTAGESLVTQPIASFLPFTERTTSTTVEFNFDHEFLAASDIGGQGYFECTISISGDEFSASEILESQIRLIHVDINDNPTEIVGTISEIIASNIAEERIFKVSITLTIPNTHFSIGEKLRLEYKMITVEDTAGNFKVWHNPSNVGSPGNYTTGGTAATTMNLTIPFRIRQ